MRFVLFVNENNKEKVYQRVEEIASVWSSSRVAIICLASSILQDEIKSKLKEIKEDFPAQIRTHLICETEENWEEKVIDCSPIDIGSYDLVCFVDENLRTDELLELIRDARIVSRSGAVSAYYEDSFYRVRDGELYPLGEVTDRLMTIDVFPMRGLAVPANTFEMVCRQAKLYALYDLGIEMHKLGFQSYVNTDVRRKTNNAEDNFLEGLTS